MAGTETRIKLTSKSVEKLAREQPSADVWDTELAGFHVRSSMRGLTFRLYYRTKTGKRRMMTLGTYGALTTKWTDEINLTSMYNCRSSPCGAYFQFSIYNTEKNKKKPILSLSL